MASKVEDSQPDHPQPEPPVRVLVQTLTHLVPGDDGIEREQFILNRICQYHWNCDFQAPKFRYASYDANFAFNSRRCFFLVDYGEAENDDDVPVLPYEWTGQCLKPLSQLVRDPQIQDKLKNEIPFTRQPRKREKLPVRESVRLRLYRKTNIPPEELDYMRQSPDDLKWLKSKLKLRSWQTFVAEANRYRPIGAPEIEE